MTFKPVGIDEDSLFPPRVEARLYATFVGPQATLLYVRPNGNDNGTGSTPGKPFATIPAALAYLATHGNVGVIDLGSNVTHTLTAGITIDATKHELRGGPRCLIDCTGMTSGAAITVVGNPAEVGVRSARAVLTDIELVGSGKTSSVDGVVFVETAGRGVYHIGPERLHLSFFRRGVTYGDHSYNITLWNATIHNCGTGIYDAPGSVAAGERLTFMSNTYMDNTLDVWAGDDGADLYFTNCSFDYSDRFIELEGGAKAYLTDCHLETTDSDTGVLFTLSSNYGYLRMSGGMLMVEGTTAVASRTRPSMVVVNNDSMALFSDVWMQGIGLASGVFATGAGRCEIKNTRTPLELTYNKLLTTHASNTRLVDGGFEAAGVLDQWAIVGDTAPVTSRLAGTNLTIARTTAVSRTGAGSLMLTKGAGGTAKAGLFVPLVGRRPLTSRLWLSAPGAQTGTLSFFIRWVAASEISTYGVPIYSQVGATVVFTSYTKTAAAMPWTPYDSGGRLLYPPANATHMLIGVDMTSLTAGSVYVDDAEVYDW